MKKNFVGKIYNMSRSLFIAKVPIIPKFLWIINRMVFACDIPYTANIDKTVTFSHNGLGVVINGKSSIGENTLVLQNVTLGGNMGKKREINGRVITSPIVGKNVIIGAGASILGPVIVGDNARIGAGAVVLQDVPEGTIALGVPAKIIK